MSGVRTVYQRARIETAKLLGYGDDLETLTPEQSTRLDIACALRIALDDQAAKLLRGETSDVAKLLSASEALGRILPPTVLASPPPPTNRVDPREIMLQTYLAMRHRAVPAISEHGRLVDSLRASLIGLAEEIEAARADLVAPETSGAQAPAGNVVKLSPRSPVRAVPAAPPKPAPPQATPAYDYNTQSSWRDYVEPTGEIRSTPRGGGHDWGPV
jgi:hypothetical protein